MDIEIRMPYINTNFDTISVWGIISSINAIITAEFWLEFEHYLI